MKIVSRGVFLLLIGFVALFGLTSMSCQAQGMYGNPMIGKKAPEATLATTSGTEQSLHTVIQGKKAIVVFWATWCPHCREQLKSLVEEKSEIEKAGIVVQLVNIGEDKDTVQQFLQKNNYDFSVMLDVDSRAAEAYQVMGIPTLAFIGADGKIRDVQYELGEDFEQVLK